VAGCHRFCTLASQQRMRKTLRAWRRMSSGRPCRPRKFQPEASRKTVAVVHRRAGQRQFSNDPLLAHTQGQQGLAKARFDPCGRRLWFEGLRRLQARGAGALGALVVGGECASSFIEAGGPGQRRYAAGDPGGRWKAGRPQCAPLLAASSLRRAGNQVFPGTYGRRSDRATRRRWPHRCGQGGGNPDGRRGAVAGQPEEGRDKSSLEAWLQRFAGDTGGLGRCRCDGGVATTGAMGQGKVGQDSGQAREHRKGGQLRRRCGGPIPASGGGCSATKARKRR